MHQAHSLPVHRRPVRREDVRPRLAEHARRVDWTRTLEDAQLQLPLQLAQLADRGVVERHHRALLDRAELTEHVDELLLEALVDDGQLLDLDHQADLAERELDHVVQQRDVLSVARVQLAQLGRGVVAHQAVAVGGALERVVVDDHQAAVRRQVNVAFDEVATRVDRGAERLHGVLWKLRRIAAVAAEKRPALVVCVLVTRVDAQRHEGRSESNGLCSWDPTGGCL